ncbi:DUF475 domain-containing protein [Methanospirillum sp. J.3.6.1-F.2.7.3]|uniref:DUF475 domain-containing protein n=3 Tax=Methanospirillum TaxID=2202 RepID=A0A8E7AYX9_9EURY|nr:MULTISPECIES: DUF475 domain-containing protein [Methanospirillum]MDX8550338.1 DUF475 domain-containing protein [Methanospirillum hungatei]NLW75061.1 DUF475 domain-containing protein [Methanomicrobiales archaeon]QVV88001.1 DUF475 domain-containing protein [Methanospirillum sp. J.3.6.1-F.2.7.3]QXO95472.1 DUF475 domain-containing protein [Methanospirillum hungatei]
MELFTIILTIMGLCMFEIICSIDNAIINAEVLGTMHPKYRRWFLLWGILFAVFLVRGLLPLLLVWLSTPDLTPWEAFTAMFSDNPDVKEAIETSSPILLIGGGTFLIFLFFHWLFLEEKNFGLRGERYFFSKGVWFYAVVSILLMAIVWFAIERNPMMAFGAVVGSTAFFIVHGFRQNAELQEQKLMGGDLSDISKILYLEVIDATFSIDGVLGAFAFTMSVPLILVGNALGAIAVRQITVGNIDRIKKYRFLKNGAMYSILCLGIIMLIDSFGFHIPEFVSPVITFGVVGLFYLKSVRDSEKNSPDA